MNNHSTAKFYRTHYGERNPAELDALCAFHSNPYPTGDPGRDPVLYQDTVGSGDRCFEPLTAGTSHTTTQTLSDESDSDSWYETLFV